MRRLLANYGVYLALALLMIVAAIVSPTIYSAQSIFLNLRQASQLGIVAMGQTLVMLVGGLDLSVTGVIVLTSVIIADVGEGQNSLIVPAVLIALVMGALIGLGNGLLITKRQPQAPQAAKLDRWAHDTNFPKGEAVEFLRHTIRANPGEITLFAIGPLTNIALLFHSDPEIPSLLKELVLMCGVFAGVNWQQEPLEWNAILDPHATAMVYRAQPPLHRSVGLDVTTKVVMARDEVRHRFQTPYLLPVLDFADVWFEQRPEITFHDPLAATLIFDDSICRYMTGEVTVELEDKSRLGQTKWTPGHGHHSVALGVDAAKFFDHYFAVFEPPTL